ncbi:hypothetical protein CHLNCDRAFT_133154 [Chlorella variabilis]|uniref:CRAL-TRIO domain-containing protein n=1 Tax=Chlorella variabilis TaxID=554065 RepID=E1Z2H1_CHLVA|nr:hypothetical protein CHLNCDRAFT_133154 [Chlorella variabilis]EFN59997.1 hypothetical protein CHLNCDRAFT_133154 [Chlorella variabilis]|eukprot:XP_005852099.1 hypothetical protein CHLNCDRAFT_133154 [Chlorella variabilis]
MEHDSVTSWFVRRRAAAPPVQEGADGKQQKGKGKQKEAVAAPADKKPSNPVAAAAAAVAAAAAEKKDRKAAGAAPASDKKPSSASAAGDKKAAGAAAGDKKVPAAGAGAGKQAPAAGAAAAKKPPAASAAPAKKGPGAGTAVDKKAAAPAAAADDRKQRAAPPAAVPAAPSSGADSDSDEEPALAPAGREQGAGEQQQGGERERERELFDEAEYRPRVVAYSDSDSDVESHFKRVKTHLLPPSEEEAAERAAAEAAAAAAAAAEEAAAAEAARQQAGLRRLRGAVAGAAGAAGRSLGPHLTAALAARAGGLLLLGRARPRAAYAAGLLGAAVPLAGAAAARAGLDLGALPAPLLAAGQELEQLGKAALALAAARLLRVGLQRQRRRRQERRRRRSEALADAAGRADAATATEGEQPATPGRLLRRKSSVNLAALRACADLGAAIEARQPHPAAEWAAAGHPQTGAEWGAVYGVEVQEMGRMLQENEVELPGDRFDATNAELLRFAKACNLLTAKTPEQRAAAVEAGVSRVVHTQEWAGRQRFMSDRELRRWERLVAWKAHDASGRPILLARVGRAQQLVKPERYDDFATALLTLVHRGLTTQLSNSNGPGEQMVVVLDCRGGSSIGLTRHMGLLKKLAVTLNQHYPDRLFRLHLLELPLLLRWVLHAVTPLLHPNTRSKVVLSSMSDPGLPVTVAFLSNRRSVAKPSSMKRSISNCSFPSSGDATPALLSPQQTPSASLLPAMVAAATAGMAAGAEAGTSTAGTASGQQLGDDDIPTTPPPTLKAPHSPREVAKPRQQQQQQQAGQQQQQQQQWAVALGPEAGQPRPTPSSPFVCKTPAQQAQQQAQQAAAAVQGLGQPPAAAVGSQAGAGAAAAAAGDRAAGQPPVSAAASAAQGITSHAVPWSPGMQSPAGALSRDSSCGDEPVSAARAKAAADAVRELEQWQQQHALQAGTQAGSGSRDGAGGLTGRLGQPQLQLQRLESAGSSISLPPLASALSAPPAMPTPPAASPGSASSGSALGSWLGGLLPGQWGAAAADQAGQQQRQRRVRRQPVHRLPLAGMLAGREGGGGSGGSTPRTPQSGRPKMVGGLVELPERTGRLTPGRCQTPRKSSLRRSESADSLPTSRSRLGSHPLRRQSSVSWAEELESIKEIHARESPPHGALRTRLASVTHPQLLLLACILSLVMAAALQRLLLTLTL